MRNTIRLALLAGLFFCVSGAFAQLPWKNGEKLSYEVHWGLIIAADALFTAKGEGKDWTMSLNLRSRGVIEAVNPIRSKFVSRLQTGPWQSLQFEEDRSEGKKKKKNKTLVQYASLKGKYQDLLGGTTEEFSLPREGLDDLGSLLYAIRVQDWRREKERIFTVYDGPKIKHGRARFAGEVTRAVGTWPSQKLLVVEAWPEDEKGKRKKGSLKLWITDDERRLPLRADFEAKFGTFEIDLVKVEP